MTLAAALVAALAAPATAGATITEFSAGLTPSRAPADIAAGPDGNLWFTEPGAPGGIGEISPTGQITEHTAGVTPGLSVGVQPSHIAAGPDNAMWFTDPGNAVIGRFNLSTGTVTEYPTSRPSSAPSGIALGPDGNLWYTDRGRSTIGRITPTGFITEYPTPTANSAPVDIEAGPDDNLWFTQQGAGGRIGRIDPDDGDIDEYSDGLTPSSAPTEIVKASNGKLYFTQAADPGRIGRIHTDGDIDEYTTGLTANSRPSGIAEGGDGAIWFTQGADPGRLGRLWTPSSAITEFTGGLALDMTANATPAGITQGPDGNVWFTERGVNGAIARATVPPRVEIDYPKAVASEDNRSDDDFTGTVRLLAGVRPNSQPTTYFFEYGPETGYGERTIAASAGAGAAVVAVETEVELAPDAQYHLRVTAVNGSGTAVSSDKPFYLTDDGEVLGGKPTGGGSSVVDVVPAPAPAPAAAAHAAAGVLPPAPPVLGEAVVVAPVEGSIRVRPPGARRYRDLAAGAHVPVGSMVDARRGKVQLVSARDAQGRTQKGTFWGSVFQVRQPRALKGVTDLVLRGGSFRGCTRPRAGASALARDAARRRTVRSLWGQDRHARFRTHGRDSVATVRGTTWLTSDRCAGTLTRVKEGEVLVRDLRRKRSVLLRAGRAYFARHRQR